MPIEIVTMPPMRVAAIRHIGPYDEISRTFDAFGRIAEPAGLFAAPGATMIAIYHDDPQTTPAARLRSDAGLTLAGDAVVPAGLSEQRVEGGHYLRAIHVGSYRALPSAWDAAKRDVGTRGRHRRPGATFEIYRNTPMDTPEANLVTEIYIPIT